MVDASQLFRKEKNPRTAARIRAVYLAMMDKIAPEIACVLGYTRRSIQNWIYAYNRKRIEGLKESCGRGNKSKLNEDQIQWLRQGIEQGPTAEDKVCIPCRRYSRDYRETIWRQLSCSLRT